MPETFGPYRLESLLGQGGMGEVWRAVDTRKGRTVAVKVLGTWLARDGDFAARFRREAALTAQLNSPNVVPIHDYGEIDGRLFLEMPLVAGRDLATALQQSGSLPPERAVGIAAQVGRALATAHAAGLVHRDVKPSNILITGADGDEHAYLIDFGISRALDGSRLSLSGAVIGTPAYMAPERFAGEGDARSDVYALGCVLYQMLTGRLPFEATNPLVLMNAHQNSPPPRPSVMRAGLPPGLDDVVARAMAKNPTQRFATVADLVAAARAAVSTPPPPAPPPAQPAAPTVIGPYPAPAAFVPAPSHQPARPPAAPPRVSEPARPPARRRRLLIGVAVVTVVAVLAAVTLVVIVKLRGATPATSTSSSSSGSPTVASFTGVGPITVAQAKDTSGFTAGAVDDWNRQHPEQKVTLAELSSDADAQRSDLLNNAATYSVMTLDTVWLPEFVANGSIVELPKERFPLAEMLPSVVSAANYRQRLYAVPSNTDGGLLYYRTDLLQAAGIAAPPTAWADLVEDCRKIAATRAGRGINCYAGQLDKYEGLTVNVAEVIASAGGTILDAAGKPAVNTPQARQGLDFLVSGLNDGYIPREALTYKEEESRRAFQEGKLVFQRQWPYQYGLASQTDGSSLVAGKFAVAPIPGMPGPGASSLGGHLLAVSTQAANKKTALDFIAFITSQANSRSQLEKASLAPIYTALYDDPALQKEFPYLAVLKQSLLHAVPRPQAVRYGDVTLAIQDAAFGAIQGTLTTDQALAQMQAKLVEVMGS